MPNILFGFIFVVIAGFVQGTWALFLKPQKNFNWENSWLIYSVVATLILPFLLLVLFVPNSFSFISSLNSNNVLLPMLFGALWGIGSILFGLSVARIGVALTASIVLGLTTLLGTILPFFMDTPLPFGNSLTILLAGLIAMLLGIAVSGYSGVLREKNKTKTSKEVFVGVLIAVIGGVFSPMLNIAFIKGQPLAQIAKNLGADSLNSTFAIWFVVLLAGFFVNTFYAIYLLFKNSSWTHYKKLTGKFLGANILAGALWFISLIFFGIATIKIGRIGPSIGWAIFIALSIVIANVWGMVLGEWKGSKKAMRYQLISILLILIGITCIAASVLGVTPISS